MKRLIEAFATHPIAANLVMGSIVAAGLLSAPQLRQEPFPNVAFDLVSITVTYDGAAPDEVEEAICVRLEEAIEGVEGIHRISSTATEGFASVAARLAVGADPRRVLGEVRSRVDALETLPEDAEKPIIQELYDSSVLLSVVVFGDIDLLALRRVAEQVRDDVSALPEISRAELVGVPPYEISIEVSETRLRRHGLSFDDVADAVRDSSLNLPGGSLKARAGEMLLRTRKQAYHGRELERLVLLSDGDGTRLHLGDVARVVDGFADTDESVRLDGKPAALVRLLTRDARKGLVASRAVREYVAAARGRMPEGLEMTIWNDRSRALEQRRDLLLKNAGQGLVLIVLVLALFLGLRFALWIGVGIPIAFLGALAVMSWLDVSVNMMSLFAFIVALGLIVDDAIVVSESVARHQAGQDDGLRGAVEGCHAVAMPVAASVVTTVLFLLPALGLPTAIGKIVRSLAVVTIACLAFSLVESLLILPAHLARGVRRVPSSAALERFVDKVYRPCLESCLRWPYITVSVALVALMLAVASVAGGWVPFKFLPEVEADLVTAEVVLEPGTPIEMTEAALRHMEERALELRAELRSSSVPVFVHRLTAIGSPPDEHDDFKRGHEGAHVGRIRIQLAPGDTRTISSLELEERWRERVGAIPGALSVRFTGSDIADEPPIDLQLSSADPVQLERAVESLKRSLAAFPGVREVSDSLRAGKQEARLSIRPTAEALGLSLAELARQVRQGFHGEEVQRIQRGRDDVAVVVRYPAEHRRSFGHLRRASIRTPDGGEVPFTTVADVEIGRGYSLIARADRRRTVNVTADVDPSMASAGKVLTQLKENVLPRLAADHPRVEVAADGMLREESEMLSSLGRGSLLALFVAYGLLAVLLRSYVQPFLIVLTVPFGLAGAVAGHALLGLTLSGLSIVGLVALTGVVVNDTLVLIDQVNRRRSHGAPPGEALREAAVTRFRPILLTSLTTFFGLLPLLFESSAQAAWLKPVAATLGFGVMFATAMTLLLLPAVYVILEDCATRLNR